MDRRRLALIAAALLVVAGIVAWSRTRPTADPATRPTTTLATGATNPDPSKTTAIDRAAEPGVGEAAEPDTESAREWAIGFVASTEPLLGLGTIRFREAMRELTVAEIAGEMTAAMEASRAVLGDDARTPVSSQVWIEVPVSASVIDPAGPVVAVWSVIVNARVGVAPQSGWRTSTLTLQPDPVVGWRLAGFESVPGPTPVAGDQLPAEWAEFAPVAAWPPATASLPVGGG